MSEDESENRRAIRKQLERHAAAATCSHWKSLLRRLESGEDLAASMATRCLGKDKETQQRIAAAYYGPKRIREFAGKSVAAHLSKISPWLGHAIDGFFDTLYEDEAPSKKELAEWEHGIAELAQATYVAVVLDHLAQQTCVSPWPDESVPYGDLYEITASGYSTGSELCLYKASGHPFEDWERKATYLGMRENFYDNAAGDGVDVEWWRFEQQDDHDEFAIVVDVYEVEPEPSSQDYK